MPLLSLHRCKSHHLGICFCFHPGQASQAMHAPPAHLSRAGSSHLVAARKAARTQPRAAVSRPGRARAAL